MKPPAFEIGGNRRLIEFLLLGRWWFRNTILITSFSCSVSVFQQHRESQNNINMIQLRGVIEYLNILKVSL